MEDLSLHILDIVENSIRAGATYVQIFISIDEKNDLLTLEILDNGKGMNEETKLKVLDPFFTTKQGKEVGLGLPLLAQSAQLAGGKLELESKPDTGTLIYAEFKLSHPDCIPLGNVISTIESLVFINREVNLVFKFSKNNRNFTFDSFKFLNGNEGISQSRFIQLLRNKLNSGLKDILSSKIKSNTELVEANNNRSENR